MKNFIGNLLFCIAGVSVAYALLSVFQVNHFVWTLLKGRYYQYVSLFLPSLVVFFLVYTTLFTKPVGILRSLVIGIVVGYACGFVAFFFLPIFQLKTFGEIFRTADVSGMFLLSPVLSMSWLLGGIALLVASTLQRKFETAGAPAPSRGIGD